MDAVSASASVAGDCCEFCSVVAVDFGLHPSAVRPGWHRRRNSVGGRGRRGNGRMTESRLLAGRRSGGNSLGGRQRGGNGAAREGSSIAECALIPVDQWHETGSKNHQVIVPSSRTRATIGFKGLRRKSSGLPHLSFLCKSAACRRWPPGYHEMRLINAAANYNADGV